MLRSDLTSRVARAHENAVKAYGLWISATTGTRKAETLWIRYENAEKKFDYAMANLIDSARR